MWRTKCFNIFVKLKKISWRKQSWRFSWNLSIFIALIIKFLKSWFDNRCNYNQKKMPFVQTFAPPNQYKLAKWPRWNHNARRWSCSWRENEKVMIENRESLLIKMSMQWSALLSAHRRLVYKYCTVLELARHQALNCEIVHAGLVSTA